MVSLVNNVRRKISIWIHDVQMSDPNFRKGRAESRTIFQWTLGWMLQPGMGSIWVCSSLVTLVIYSCWELLLYLQLCNEFGLPKNRTFISLAAPYIVCHTEYGVPDVHSHRLALGCLVCLWINKQTINPKIEPTGGFMLICNFKQRFCVRHCTCLV